MTAITDTPHLILIDGSGYIFRAFHALPPMTRADGTPVNAVFGFTNILGRFLKDHTGTHIAVVFDAGAVTFRNRIYDQYKAQRPEPPPELIPQFKLCRDATDAFGVPRIELEDWEADDLIATYARLATEAGMRTTIVSSDKDLMQLIDAQVGLLDPIKQKPIGPAEVLEKFGVSPEKVVEVQALMGDSVDNVPGVPGIGPKGAAELIQTYGDVEAVLAAAPAMKPGKRRDNLIAHAEAARISRKLVELARNAPTPLTLEELAARPIDKDRLADFLHQMGFRSTALRLGVEPGAQPAAQAEPTAPADAPFGPYKLMTDEAGLEQFLGTARSTRHLALHVQTDGSPRALQTQLLGLGLATSPGQAVYIPLAGGDLSTPCLAKAQVFAALAPLLADDGILKLIADAKFASLVLTQAGLPQPAPLDDPCLISYAQSAGRHDHELGSLAGRHLSHSAKTWDQTTGTGRNRLAFADVPWERACAFGAERADLTLRLCRLLRPNLRTEGALALYEQVERRLIPILAEMERTGIIVDAAALRAMSADFGARMAVMEAEAFRLAGREFQMGSTKQLGEILFDELKLPGGKRTPSGIWGTDASVLQGLAEQGHQLPQVLLDWRQLAKLKSTYADALVDEINPATGRVHTNYAMALTSTGRLSSNDPNLQNIPIRTEEGARIREVFVAAPGCVLLSADYSQIELRLLAHVADIPTLREAFLSGQDIHARTASEVFGIPLAEMDATTRRRAKAINFGIIYGISAYGLARQLGIEPGEAKAYIDAYFARYPGIRDYMERTKEEARSFGYVKTPFGRRCYIAGINDKIPARRAGAERQAINAPLQGGAADIIKRAMVRIPAALAQAGLRAKLLLQVHDELLFETPVEEAEALAELAKTTMQSAVDLAIPLVVETGTGPSWGAAH